jgi:hypothetical protein
MVNMLLKFDAFFVPEGNDIMMMSVSSCGCPGKCDWGLVVTASSKPQLIGPFVAAYPLSVGPVSGSARRRVTKNHWTRVGREERWPVVKDLDWVRI